MLLSRIWNADKRLCFAGLFLGFGLVSSGGVPPPAYNTGLDGHYRVNFSGASAHDSCG